MERSEIWKEEAALVELAQAGDPKAFDELTRKYRPALTVIIGSMVARDCVDDIVQDALLTAYKALPKLMDPQRFAGWLTTIARRRALGSLTARREITGVDRLILAYVPAITEALIDSETNRSLAAAVARLPPDQRTVVELYYGSEMSVGTIGEMLGLSTPTVKWRLHEARRRLRDQLAFLQENE